MKLYNNSIGEIYLGPIRLLKNDYLCTSQGSQIMKKLRSIDLFSGIGGIRLGFDRVFEDSIETVFVSEWDIHAQKTYKSNFKDDFEIVKFFAQLFNHHFLRSFCF